MKSTLRTLCLDTFTGSASKLAIIGDHASEEINYGHAGKLVDQISARLFQAGLLPGDTIVSWANLNTQSVLLAWACFVSNIIFVPLASTWSEERVQFVLEEVRPHLIFADLAHKKLVKEYRLQSSEVQFVLYDNSESCVESDESVFNSWLQELDESNSKWLNTQ